MKISILISTYNGEKDIRLLLDSIQELEAGSCILEVILRDDASSDETVAIVKEEYNWVTLIVGKGSNVGFVKSNNIAFQQATGDIICCVNQDTILHRKFIAAALQILEANSTAVGINTNMIMPWVMTLEQFRDTEDADISTHEFQLTPYGFVQYVEVAGTQHLTNFMTGGGFFIRKSVLSQDHYLFDPEIDMYCEDTELSLRVQEKGGIILYSPQALIYHNQVSRTANKISELVKLYKVTRNRIALFSRIYNPLVFTCKYPLLLIGIIKKTTYLGLPSGKRGVAYIASGGLVVLFFCLFPFWFSKSMKSKKRHIELST